MLKYLVMRIVAMVPLAFVILLMVFTLGHLAPGDPITKMYMEASPTQIILTEEQLAAERARYGLDKPLAEQFLAYIGKVARGDFGISIYDKRPVLPTILEVLPISAQLGGMAFLGLIVVGIPLGILAALKRNTIVDYAIVGTSLALRTVPVYVLAPLLLIVLVLKLKVMNVPHGWKGLLSANNILPVLLLMMYPLATVIRQMRAGILDVLANDYVRTAHAKGLPRRLVITRHVMRNALIPVVTYLGILVVGLIGGSIFVETIFSIPGYGQMATNSIIRRDYPVMMGCTLFGAFMVMASNLLVDIVYPFLDPRVKL